MTSKISIVIAVYNGAPYLSECLESVMRQSVRELEIICVDDGSTDTSVDILKKYADQDARVVILSQKNQGAGAARNNGLSIASGEFICFLDADDFYADDKALEDLYEAAIINQAMICGGSLVEYADGVRLPTPHKNPPPTIVLKEGAREFGIGHFPFGITRFIYNLQLVKDNGLYFTTHARAQDTHWLARVLATAKSYYLIKRDVYVYRVSHKQVDWNRRRRLDLLEVNMELSRFMDKQGYVQMADYFEKKMLQYAAEFRERNLLENLRPGTWAFYKHCLVYFRYSLLSFLCRGSKKRGYQSKKNDWAQLLGRARQRHKNSLKE